MLASFGIVMLVQGTTGKAGEGKVILGKMGWNPVEYDADSLLVALIDQVAKIIRFAKP